MTLPPLFLGPMELAVIGLILLVLIFGSKAPDIAGRVGEGVSKVEEPKQKLEAEIEDLKGTSEEVREEMGIDEELDDLEDEVADGQERMDPGADLMDGPEESAPRDDNV